MLCQKELAAFAGRAAGDVVVACTQEARLFGDVAEEGGKTQTIRFVNIRETGGWSAEATRRDAQDRRAARAGGTARARAGAARGLSVRGPPADRRPGRGRAALGEARCRAQLAVTVLVTGRAAGAELPAERDFPVYSGKLTKLAGWLGAFDVDVDAGKSDRPRPVHALQRLRPRLPRAGDRLQLPDRPRPLQGASQVRRRLRRDRRDRLRAAATSRAASASTSCSTCSAAPHLRMHQPPQGYLAPGADAARAGAGGGRARGDGRRVREAEVLRLQGVDLRAQPLAASPAATSASTSARPRRSPPTATTSRSSRTCAWAAARARPCARRAR